MSITHKLIEIFNFNDFNIQENIFTIIKREFIIFLNREENVKNVDYKSLGVFFGLSYIKERNSKKIDILLLKQFSFQHLYRFLHKLIIFLCNRNKLISKRSVLTISKIFTFDELKIKNILYNINDILLFEYIQKLWKTIYNFELKNPTRIKFYTNEEKPIIHRVTSSSYNKFKELENNDDDNDNDNDSDSDSINDEDEKKSIIYIPENIIDDNKTILTPPKLKHTETKISNYSSSSRWVDLSDDE